MPSIEDMNLKYSDEQEIKIFIEILRYQRNNDEIKISFPTSNYSEYHNFYKYVDWGKRFDIDVIPSINIETKEGYGINIYNPSKNGCKLINQLIKDKEYWLSHVFEKLFNLNIHIVPSNIMEKTGKEFVNITPDDIIDEILEEGYCMEDLSYAKAATYPVFQIPNIKYPIIELSKKLVNEKTYLVVNNNSSKTDVYNLLDEGVINGLVLTKENHDEFYDSNIDIFKSEGVDINSYI